MMLKDNIIFRNDFGDGSATDFVMPSAGERFYATGKRKSDAVARVYLKIGTGQILVNGKPINEYFITQKNYFTAVLSLKHLGMVNKIDAQITVKGGGLAGQAGAVCHGLSKALFLLSNKSPELKIFLKKYKFLTRDARVVEPKKYGRPKARRSRQFSKR